VTHPDERKCKVKSDKSSSATPITLLKFGAAWCGPCQQMAKARTLEKFAAAHPEVKVQILDCDAHENLAEAYSVESVPICIFVAGAGELLREEGAINLRLLEKAYEVAKGRLAKGER
jgi:thiol-disulfide isomerase/thioredoxin